MTDSRTNVFASVSAIFALVVTFARRRAKK